MSRSLPILVEPAYGYTRAHGAPYRPTTREALVEWLDAINITKGRAHFIPFLTALVHIGSGVCSLVYMTYFLTWDSLPSRVFSFAVGGVFGIVYHSVWWHRYCTHKAFTIRRVGWARLFTWTNPLFYRDETFVIPHRVHHQIADAPGDPYTPQAGWLVCYLSAETQQRLNRNISREQYEALVRGLRHIGLRTNTYEAFRRTGSVEHVGWYILHAVIGQLVWAVPLALFGGVLWVLSLYSAIFWSMAILRDFNYRGHTNDHPHAPEEGWDYGEGLSINHRLYGYMSGEWHNNHHACPASARMGFLQGQLDLGFSFIKALHALGVVTSYVDQAEYFQRTYVAPRTAPPAPVAM